jgi:uncharacterized protein YjbJ (UPF0337 family)
MGDDFIDKAKNKGEELKGEVKEHVGGATGDDSMRREGERDQTKGNLKQAGEKVKDAFGK